jgi:hypothetical protein
MSEAQDQVEAMLSLDVHGFISGSGFCLIGYLQAHIIRKLAGDEGENQLECTFTAVLQLLLSISREVLT